MWQYGTKKRYEFEVHSKVSMAWILGLGPSLGLVRVPGIGLVYTELAREVPHILYHFITNVSEIHSIVVFVCVKYLPVRSVPEGEVPNWTHFRPALRISVLLLFFHSLLSFPIIKQKECNEA